MNLSDEKAKIRGEMGILLEEINRRAERSEDLLRRLIDRNAFEKVQFVSLFISFPEEVNTLPIAEYCWSRSLVVCVPEFSRHQPGQPIVFREWVRDAELVEIHPKLFHPKYGPLHRHEEIDLVIVPGLAFTLDGSRLGRGRGFYDQLLSQTKSKSIGVCFSEQITAELPTETHDFRVSEVIAV
jgi:5-formyltetrahydrofolate cyclo-ligase